MTVQTFPGGLLITGDHIPIAQLLALKGAVKLEATGMKHSSGKSARRHACRLLGISSRTKADDVIGALNKRIDALRKIATGCKDAPAGACCGNPDANGRCPVLAASLQEPGHA